MARTQAPQRQIDETYTPAAVAHTIREHTSALGNALESIRVAVGNRTDLSESLNLAASQIEALAQLADQLHNNDR
jgi:hypothetical protein